jgi:hypothetical protein
MKNNHRALLLLPVTGKSKPHFDLVFHKPQPTTYLNSKYFAAVALCVAGRDI